MKSEVKNILLFTRLFNRYKKQLYNYVLKMVSDRMIAEDLVQNVFLKLYENLNSIRLMESVNYWIFRTARNEIYAWFRRQRLQRKVFDPAELEELELDNGTDLTSEIETRELSVLIKDEINELPAGHREVFLLKEYAGLSYREIAGITGITEDLVKSRLFKIRKRLIGKLAKKII